MGRDPRAPARGVIVAVALAVASCGPGSRPETVAPPEPPPDAGAAAGDEEPAGPSIDDERIAAIEHAINATQAVRKECWAFAAASSLSLAGKVVLRLTFRDPAEKADVEIASDDTGSGRLIGCLTLVFSSMEWPPGLFEPGMAIELPFAFVSPGVQYTIDARSVDVHQTDQWHARVALDDENTGNDAVSLTLLRVKAGTRLPQRRHDSAMILYVWSGWGLLYDLAGQRKLTKGSAVYVPAGTAWGLRADGGDYGEMALVQVFAPGGPEDVYQSGIARGTTVLSDKEKRHPKRPIARPVVTALARSKTYEIAGGKGKVTFLFDHEISGDTAAYLGILEAQPGARVPLHSHVRSTEALLIIEGGGTMTVAGDTYDVSGWTAIQIPPTTEHSFTAGSEGVKALQIYAPSGPEQRFKE